MTTSRVQTSRQSDFEADMVYRLLPAPLGTEIMSLRPVQRTEGTRTSPLMQSLSATREVKYILNVTRRISPPSQTDKAFFEIERQGKRYIVKCWSPRHDRASNAECGVYERLLDSRPSGYDVFANMILNGNILCSSLFPDGRALVLPHKDGKILAHIWDELSHRERIHIREECEKAIRILRSVSIYVPDSGKHNVLYARETGAVTMLDFESAIECPQSDHMPYVELTSLFGDGFMRGHTSGG